MLDQLYTIELLNPRRISASGPVAGSTLSASAEPASSNRPLTSRVTNTNDAARFV